MTKEQDISLAQDIHNITEAIQTGRLNIPEDHRRVYEELMQAPRGILGIIDTTNLSPEAKSIAKSTGMILRSLSGGQIKKSGEKMSSETQENIQSKLFALFDQLFKALIGFDSNLISDASELKKLMIQRATDHYDSFSKETNETLQELTEFYQENKHTLYSQARLLGGVKFVSGGQRAFLKSAFNGVRIAGLYADTQLIPDPIYPYLSGDVHQNAAHLQMANTLFFILKLKPLIDARLPVPPVFVFPSFELELESHDMLTKHGVNDLTLKLVSPICGSTITSMEDLADYIRKHEETFINAVMAEKLFVPPGSSPDERLSGSEAISRYFAELEGKREAKMIADMRKLPPGILILIGLMERLGSQFHLFDNSTSLNAQPLLHQDVHWHYYVKCCEASARSLVNNQVLSQDSFLTIKALKDDSLSWLANIPIEGLVELAKNQEHQWFREELKNYASQLTLAGAAEINDVLREVNHALSDLLQRHQRAIREIEEKYAGTRKWSIAAAASTGIGAFASLLPFLSPELGVPAASLVATMGAATLGSIPVGQHHDKEWEEKQKINRSMLGMLAMAR